jgi:glycosyltransferase involved in cell wall biosynthesis
MRIVYAAGPGNVMETYNYWVKGQDDPSQVAITYSAQFYDVCYALEAEAYVISSSEEKKFLRDGRFMIEHRPIPFRKSSGLLYHFGQLWYGLWLIVSAVLFRADIAVIADGTTHWFVLSLLPCLGVQVIPSLHCILWRKYCSPKTVQKLILRLNRHLFASRCTAILTASNDISEQVVHLTEGNHRPIAQFLPIYRPSEFAEVGEPEAQHLPFRVLFIGRIERNKGVFDLLEIAQRFATEKRPDITFDLCGNGSAMESLRLAIQQAGVNASFICHGHCNKTQMREMFTNAHAIIVPTKTDFVEGFNQVVSEGVLSGRPIITSKVCPALSYVREAVVEVPPDDTKAYGDAILKLCDDREFYEEKRQACLGLQEQFYDISKSWGAVLKSIIENTLISAQNLH